MNWLRNRINRQFAEAMQRDRAAAAAPKRRPHGHNYSAVMGGPVGPVGPAGASGVLADDSKSPSNARFRSFAERYIIERCRDWKQGEIDEQAWAAILEAKSLYSKVREVSRTINDAG